MNGVGLALLVMAAAYLVGSIPTAYLVARAVKGIDIREHGSGTVGGSNVWAQVGFVGFLVVLVVDVLKGALAVILGLGFGGTLPWGALAGVAAIIGHNWSVWMGGAGGRGLATYLGVLSVLAPREGAVFVAFFVLGYFLKQGAILALAGLSLVPILASILGEPGSVLISTLVLWGLMVAKRLLGNEPLRAANPAERWRILRNRLLYDRDTEDYQTWMRRRPGDSDPRR